MEKNNSFLGRVRNQTGFQARLDLRQFPLSPV